MDLNNFELMIIAFLNKQLSKKSINGDLRTMDNSMYVRVLAKLSKTLARKQLKSQLKELNDLYVKVGANIAIDKNAKAQLQKNIQMLQKSISELEIGLKASKYQQNRINAEIKSIRNKLQKDADNRPISFNLQVRKEKLLADIEYWGKRYSKLFSDTSASKKYEQIMHNAVNVSNKGQLKDARLQLSAFTSELKANELATKSTADKWKSLIDRSKDLLSAAMVVRVVFSQLRQSVSTFIELDTAMTNVWKVSDDIVSREQFSGLLSKWNKLAQNLSVTTTSLINSIEEWSKIGFDLNASEELAKLTTIFEKTAEISNDLANKTLVSTAQAFTQIDGFGEEDYVERVEAVGNKINAIGNKYAISSEGISEALQNSSAALVMANNDLDESIALITAGNKIFQAPEEMGNTLKVVSSRLRGQKGELEELGEDTEGMIESVSKVQTQILNLTGNKVNIFEKDNETIKSTYDILLEVGKIYDSLSDKDQASLTEILFGKQRMSAGSAILLNYKELEAVKNDSINASNSMAMEYEKYMQSAEASITTFKEKLIETYSVFMSGDMIKFAADTGSAFLDFASKTDLIRHSLLAIATINIGKGISTVGAVIASTTKEMNLLGSALEKVKNLPLDNVLRKDAIVELCDATKGLSEKNLDLLLSQKQLSNADRIAIIQKTTLTKEEKKAKLAKLQLTTATNNQTKANVAETTTTMTLSGAMTSLKTTIHGVGMAIKSSFLSNPIGWILLGITTAVSIGATALDSYNQKIEETKQQFSDLKTEVSEIESELKSLNTELQTTVDRMNELESKEALTFTEKEELDNLIKQNNELQRRIDLLDLEQKTKNREKNKTFVDIMNSDVQDTGEYAKDSFGNVIKGNAGLYGVVGGMSGSTEAYTRASEEDYINQQFEDRAKLLEEKRNAETKEEQERIQKQIDDIDSYLQSKSTQWKNDATDINYIQNPTTEDEKAVNAWLDYIADFQDKMAIAMDGTNAKTNTFNRLVDNGQFKEVTEELQSLGKQGEVTADMLDDPKYDEFISKLVELGVIDTEEDLSQVALAFSNVAKSADTAATSTSQYKEEVESLETLNTNINTALDSIQKSYDAVEKFKDAMSNGMTDSALDAVADLSDELKAMVAEFYAGTVSADELFKSLTDHYNNDLENYSKAIIAKNELSEDFYNEVVLSDTEFVNHMSDNYEVDISNCKSYADAKLKIEQTLLGKVSAMWSKYYNAQTQSFTQEWTNINSEISKLQSKKNLTNSLGVNNLFGIGGDPLNSFSEADNLRLQQLITIRDSISDRTDAYESAMDALNKVAYNGISSSFEGIGASLSKSSASSSSSSSSSKETAESFNWIEVAIEKVQRTISKLGDVVSSTYKRWSTRNNALAQEIYTVNDEVKLQQKAYDKYMSLANSVGLSSYYKDLVHNGAIQIDSISNESLREQIKQYQNFYEQALECEDAVEKLRSELVNLAETKFDNIASEFDNQLSMIEQQANIVDALMEKAENKGYMLSAKYYDALLNAENRTLAELQEKHDALNKSFDEMVSSGAIEEYSEAWCDMKLEIDGVKESIVESENSVIKFNNALRDLDWEVFDKMQESMGRIPRESEFLIDLMDDKAMHDNKGNLTEHGQATLGLHAINYNTYMSRANEFARELLELNKEIADDPNNQTLLERRESLLDLQRDMILSAEDELKSIESLYSNGYEKLLNSMSKIIDKRKSMLSQMKSEYDYQKSIEKQTKEISNIERQLLAYNGDNSENSMKITQQLQVQLSEAKENLSELEWQQQIREEEKLLDALYDQTEEWINTRLDDLNGIVQSAIDSTNANADSIKATLEAETDEVGIKLSEEMSKILTSNDGMKAVVTMYGDNFGSQITTVNSTLLDIKSVIEGMVKASDTTATKDVASSVNSSSTPTTIKPVVTPTPTTTAAPTTSSTTNNSSSSGRGKSSWESALVYSKYFGNKSKLNTSTSIVDLLKSHDKSAEFNDRASLYKAMNGSGVYTGSAKQNIFMLNTMKSAGYKKGSSGIPYDQMNWVHDGEIVLKRVSDGGYLTELTSGSKVLNSKQVENLWNLSNMKPVIPNVTLPKMPAIQTREISTAPQIHDVNMTFELPHVKSADDFIDDMIDNNRFEKVVQSIAFSRNPLDKYRFKR